MLYLSISGSPCKDPFDESHKNWAPTIFSEVLKTEKSVQRTLRTENREKLKTLVVSTTKSNGDLAAINSTSQDTSSHV